MVDALLVLASAVTSTSTASNTALALPNGTPRRGLQARIVYSAAQTASSTGTAIFNIDFAPDGSTFTNIGTATTVNLTTTAKAGEIYIPINTPLMSMPNTAAVIRLTVTITGAGSPTITYSSYVGNAMP